MQSIGCIRNRAHFKIQNHTLCSFKSKFGHVSRPLFLSWAV
jgi:hypothetical protein